ncbi:MAG: OmpA family protein [Salinibacter sp.]
MSEQRAASAAEYLKEQGIASSRLITKGMDESEPVATNETAARRQKNRRVEVAIYATEEYGERVKERAGGQ